VPALVDGNPGYYMLIELDEAGWFDTRVIEVEV